MPDETHAESDLSALLLIVTCSTFPLGQLAITPNAQSRLTHCDIQKAMSRHASGDWGELEAEDKAANNCALKERSRLVSRYTSASNVVFWIITEADRSVTTILLPEDY